MTGCWRREAPSNIVIPSLSRNLPERSGGVVSLATRVGTTETTVESAAEAPRAAATAYPRLRRSRLAAIPYPLIPFLIFCLLLEIIPVFILVRDSFRVTGMGAFTWDNYAAIKEPLYWHSLRNSIALSAVTALAGAVWGALVAAAILRTDNRLRRWLIGVVAATSKFAGIPLALAFISILGANGFITLILREGFDYRIYPQKFTLYSWTGLFFIYLYFQLPLMVLLFTPAIARLKPQWQETAATLGAPIWVYWWRVGLPVMAAPFAAAVALLFANALGAYATAWALTGGKFSLFTIQIAFEVNGDISFNPGKASALSLILAVIMALSILAAQLLARRAQRWLT
jgi:putative spermidine/putrescine transport system permease protein